LQAQPLVLYSSKKQQVSRKKLEELSNVNKSFNLKDKELGLYANSRLLRHKLGLLLLV
jgi:hypothetical protein